MNVCQTTSAQTDGNVVATHANSRYVSHVGFLWRSSSTSTPDDFSEATFDALVKMNLSRPLYHRVSASFPRLSEENRLLNVTIEGCFTHFLPNAHTYFVGCGVYTPMEVSPVIIPTDLKSRIQLSLNQRMVLYPLLHPISLTSTTLPAAAGAQVEAASMWPFVILHVIVIAQDRISTRNYTIFIGKTSVGMSYLPKTIWSKFVFTYYRMPSSPSTCCN